jgi:Zn-dependent alcohol dehydrogenase
MTAYRAVVGRGCVQPGQWLAVHGCGGVGLSAVQIAAANDAMVVAVDVDDRKLAKAREEGAVATINARNISPEQVGQAVKDTTNGGAHVSIDALGRAFTFTSRSIRCASVAATCRPVSPHRRSKVKFLFRSTF